MTTWALLALQTSPIGSPVEAGLDAVRALAALVVVGAALAGFLWLLRRGTFSALGRSGRQNLAVESAVALGDRRSLVIVSVEGRRLLLGLAPTQVTLIAELARPAAFGAALDSAVTSREGPRS